MNDFLHEALRRNGGDIVRAQTEELQTFGKPGMQRFVIATRPIADRWPERYSSVLAEARRKVDAGTHTMCQGRWRHPISANSDRIVQYLMPLKRPQPPQPFFGQFASA